MIFFQQTAAFIDTALHANRHHLSGWPTAVQDCTKSLQKFTLLRWTTWNLPVNFDKILNWLRWEIVPVATLRAINRFQSALPFTLA